MLSRVADSLYWMSRYLERAEHTARLLDVNLAQMLDQSFEQTRPRWERLLASLQLTPTGAASATTETLLDPAQVAHALTLDPANQASIVACIAAARENARQVREQISSEMWEQLNRLYLSVRQTHWSIAGLGDSSEFYRVVKEGSHLFQGITDATLSHGEGWQFIQIGRSIERAGATAAMLDAHQLGEALTPLDEDGQLAYLDWVGLLKSCTAFEAYCKVYTADVQPARVAEFLLLNAEFPRSVRFAVVTIEGALQAIAAATGRRRSASRAARLAGRLSAALDYAQIDEVLADSMHAYLTNIQRQCSAIHDAIQAIYITYPIDAELAS